MARHDARIDRASVAGVFDAARGDRVHRSLLRAGERRSLNTLLVTGTVGTGKTTVLLELGDLFDERNEPYALVDLDWLSWANAPRAAPHALLLENLHAVAGTYASAGVEKLVLGRYLQSRQELDSIRDVVGDLSAVALTAPRDVLEARIRARDTGRELEHHLEALAQPAPDLDCPMVDSSGDPRATALAVLDAAGW